MKESIVTSGNTDSLNEKAEFLSQTETYGDTKEVEVIETHMSLVFLTDRFVYKLKKPVSFDFLDFSTREARQKYCMEEISVNKALAGDVYIGVIPITLFHGELQLDGQGEVIDWLVKMQRLPREHMLDTALKEATVRSEWVRMAAEKLAEFYMDSKPVCNLDQRELRGGIMRDIETNSAALLNNNFKLDHALIVGITTDLLHFMIKHEDIFVQRIAGGRIIDAHGDLRPEHICLGPRPVIIDRLEFNDELRIMDVAEELAFLGLECEMLGDASTGEVFLDVYCLKSGDNIPEMLIHFYKVKRAFLRAKLSINHLLEPKYLVDVRKWRGRCDAYLQAAAAYCRKTVNLLI